MSTAKFPLQTHFSLPRERRNVAFDSGTVDLVRDTLSAFVAGVFVMVVSAWVATRGRARRVAEAEKLETDARIRRLAAEIRHLHRETKISPFNEGWDDEPNSRRRLNESNS